MKLSELDFDTVKNYLVLEDDDATRNEISIYIRAAKSFIKAHTKLTDEQLDENEYFVIPALMLIASYYENKSTETTNKINSVYTSMINLGKVYDL